MPRTITEIPLFKLFVKICKDFWKKFALVFQAGGKPIGFIGDSNVWKA